MIALFVTAAIYISALVIERQDALNQVSRYNVAWLVSQATTEYARLEQRIGAFAIPGSGVTGTRSSFGSTSSPTASSCWSMARWRT